ncbi:hypothetical protein BD414DRAFT_475339 [Trametes punicea]|nr:hypothetical protein BD414DRAFT_475339 [Trametes punicea]
MPLAASTPCGIISYREQSTYTVTIANAACRLSNLTTGRKSAVHGHDNHSGAAVYPGRSRMRNVCVIRRRVYKQPA